MSAITLLIVAAIIFFLGMIFPIILIIIRLMTMKLP